ncbi:unnamed protein product [Spirodela intermedia]|uniref:Acyl-[acyl-carrier-protein] hydrolase n=1 Tax=Spirodela intermedia TaxID=51605 RepID=A0A7I8IRW5_SPIIN|nr:unnamed protein product [Spirodela intermedia]CAA6659904.1 unnamed protein product [Spirodela intermedia]
MLSPATPTRSAAVGSLPPLASRRWRSSAPPFLPRAMCPPQPPPAWSTAASKPTKSTTAERLRLGRLAADGLSYSENFIVRCYEVGTNKTATIDAIANLLQEVACNHAQSVGLTRDGFSTTTTMRKLGLIWVTSRMHIEVNRYPAWKLELTLVPVQGDVLEIETWGQQEDRIGTRRDWIVKDCSSGAIIGRATSKWVMMNQETRKLQRVSDEVREELAFPEEDSASLKKIPKLEDPGQYSRHGLVPRRTDLDMNQHVNHVTYIGWVLESLPQRIIDTHELQAITLDYRRECQHSDVVDSLTSLESEGMEIKGINGSSNGNPSQEDYCQFLHFLKLSGSGLEISRSRTRWRLVK